MASLPRPEAPDPLKPSPRVTDPEKLRGVYRDLYEADRFANEDRATLTDEFSGGLPWEYQELEQRGQGDVPNVNWNIGEAQIRAHISTFCNLVRSAEKIAKVYLKPDLKLSYEKRVLYQAIIADEFNHLNTKNPHWRAKFKARIELLAREYVLFGVCFAYFPDLCDWRFNAAGLNKVKVQRGATYEGPGSTEVAFMRREYTGAEFVEPLRHGEAAAKKAGWNIEQLKAATSRIMERYGFRQDLETFVHEIKNNDLYYRSGRAETIPMLHSFVQEFNGKYSWYIFTEDAVNSVKVANDDGSEVEPWLFKREFTFNDESDCLITFLMEVGTGELHSVRGTGHRLFEIDVNRNRLTNLMLDGAVQSGIPQYQSNVENAHQDFQIYTIGGGQVIPPGFTYVEKNVQNLGANLEMGVKMLNDVQDMAAGVFTTRQAGNGGGTSQDASETRAITDENIVINESDRVNFLEPLALIYNAQWRRIVKAKASDKGGLLATLLVKRCVSRGVPIDIVLEGVDYLEPQVGIFVPGTTKSQEDQIEQMTKIAGSLPINARDQIQRALVIAVGGAQNVDSLDPAIGAGGPNIQGQLAIIENPILTSGQVLPVSRNQDHLAHAVQHAVVMDPTAQNAIQLIQSGNVQATGPALQGFSALIQHQGAHIKALAQMPSPPPEFQKLNEQFKQNQGLFKQLSRVANANAQRAQKKMMEAQAKGGNGNGAQPTADEQATLIRAQGEVEINKQAAQVDNALKAQKTQASIEANQVKTAAKIQEKDVLGSQKLSQLLQQQRLKGDNSPE